MPKNAHWVSITDPGTTLLAATDERTVACQFHDIGEDAPDEYSKMTRFQARDIVDLIDKAQALEQRIDLFVNCMAGISRSAGVALYVRDLLGVKVFAPRQLVPNSYVAKMLWKAKREKEDHGSTM